VPLLSEWAWRYLSLNHALNQLTNGLEASLRACLPADKSVHARERPHVAKPRRRGYNPHMDDGLPPPSADSPGNPHDDDPLPYKKLSPEELLATVDEESHLFETPYDTLAEMKLIRATPMAVDRLIQIVAYGQDTTALRAAALILNRVFGTPSTSINPIVIPDRTQKDPLTQLMAMLSEDG
jgi:hypothetical protein